MINHLITDWYQLLNCWREEKKRNGLTFPFLIGRRIISNKNFIVDSSCINDLILEIIKSDVKEPLTIEYCPDIEEYVLAINNPGKVANGFPLTNEFSEPKIIITAGAHILGSTLNQISISLWNKYNEWIHRGKFSKNNMRWTEFTEADENMFKKLNLWRDHSKDSKIEILSL